MNKIMKENVFLFNNYLFILNKKMKISIIAGARPNFMKIAPIVRAIDKAKEQGKTISYRVIYTGIPGDESIDASLFSDLDMKKPDAYLGIHSDNLAECAGGVMFAFEKELKSHPTDVVLVVDDLTSTMACTIVAKKQGVKVAHIVAGTRSFDMNMPKEVNRMITDGLSDYLFTAGMVANRNLNQTGAETEHVYLVGNILIDTLRYNHNRFIKPVTFNILGLKEKEYILLTINRHALLEDKAHFKQMLKTIVEKSNGTPIIAPLHTYVRDAVKETGVESPTLHIILPQSYLSFGYLMNKAKGIITDSGNIAEEATFLGIPCITLNNYAEHPETCNIGTNELVGSDITAIANATDRMTKGEWKEGSLPERWDGRTAERIVQILMNE